MAVYRQESYLDRIKAIKSERKITNDKLAEMTGIGYGTVCVASAIPPSSPISLPSARRWTARWTTSSRAFRATPTTAPSRRTS